MAPSTPSGPASDRTGNRTLGWAYEQVVGEEDARVCKDIPESACRHQPRNFFAYLVANTLSKIADELSSARLILPWLMSALGVPLMLIGFLVPVREAGVLIPQLLVAAYVRGRAYRKPVWLLGAGASSVALLAIVSAALLSDGVVAGVAMLAGLAVYSLARGLCSVSAKDVLGKAVSKTRRGTVMGYSASLAGFAVLALGLLLVGLPGLSDNPLVLVILLLMATLFWWLSMLAFSAIREAPGATEGGGNGWSVAWQQVKLLRSDATFRFFVLSRSALLSVALVPPFYVVMVQQAKGGGLGLGALIIISGLASSLSSAVWGRLSDRSSQRVMALAASGAALTGLLVWGSQTWLTGTANLMGLSLGYGLIMICHGGVRLGRKAYLVDMATQDTRASYVAVSNTVVGVVMLLGGGVGFLGDLWSPLAVILLLSGLSVVAAAMCARLPAVL